MLDGPMRRWPAPTEMATALDRHSWINGLVATIFASTGPVAIILTVSAAVGFERPAIDAWIFASFVFGGVLTVYFSLRYRMPLALAWTMPGAALLISALDHLSFAEAVGAFLVAGVIMVLLGETGIIARLMAYIPATVAMAMVAGVFLPFVLNLITGVGASPVLSLSMVAAYVVCMGLPRVGRYLPPVLGALIAGCLAATLLGTGPVISLGDNWLARPALSFPEFTVRAQLELVLPILISVIAAQNLQGVTVLQQAGHQAPVSPLTIGCGFGTLAMGVFGSVPACLAGPANAILVSSGKRENQYMAAVLFGVLFAAVGLFAPLVTQAATTMPAAFTTVLGGLAMLPVLLGAFQTAFGQRGRFGPLVAFTVTVSGISLFSIGAPFWGLVFGYAVHLVIDRR